jgi:hypothetical protein
MGRRDFHPRRRYHCRSRDTADSRQACQRASVRGANVECEDWRVETPDGRIYGAYSARAQIAYARKMGYAVRRTCSKSRRTSLMPDSAIGVPVTCVTCGDRCLSGNFALASAEPRRDVVIGPQITVSAKRCGPEPPPEIRVAPGQMLLLFLERVARRAGSTHSGFRLGIVAYVAFAPFSSKTSLAT